MANIIPALDIVLQKYWKKWRSIGIPDKDCIFPYHYGEEAEQYTFYRIPKILFTSPKFRKLSCEAKLLYGLLLDRMQLSVKNRWLDADGKVYIYFSQEQIAEMMGCGLKKVGSLLAGAWQQKGNRTDNKDTAGFGKTGQDLCTTVHLCRFIRREYPDTSKWHFWIYQNGRYRYVQSAG